VSAAKAPGAGNPFERPLSVAEYTGTRPGDAERGPLVRMRSEDAVVRLLVDGELVWVYGPRRHDLATLAIDDSLPRGSVGLRDIAGVAPSEIVRVYQPGFDRPTTVNPRKKYV
jgi:hypothetical protein